MFGLGLGKLGSPGGIEEVWSPLNLFASGEEGAWYDPSDLTTLYQDAAGTTPVTAVGDPVGRVEDKSGNGNHASQSTAAARPIYRQDGNGKFYLDFDGVDDAMATGSIDFSATDKMSMFAGVHKDSDAAAGILAELSATYATNVGAFGVAAPGGQVLAANYGALLSGAGGHFNASTTASFTSPTSNAVTGLYDIAQAVRAEELTFRVDAVEQSMTYGVDASAGTGNFGNYPLYLGARAGTSIFFNGRIYSLIVRGAASNDAEIAAAEAWVASKTGVTL